MSTMRDFVEDYYGRTLKGSSSLMTDACATIAAPAPLVATALADVHPAVAARYYGCGLVIPPGLGGLNILDLGSGAGRDAFAIARLAGARGRVTGVDMTEEQIAVARAHEGWHATRFGYAAPTTRFVKGYLEDLGAIGLEPRSFDLIVSNCVINLCADKASVFAAAAALLKPGGELYFADVYADRPMPKALAAHPVLYGECLAGALYWEDFESMAIEAGFTAPRVVEHRRLSVVDPALKALVEPVRFASVTARLFKSGGADRAARGHDAVLRYNGALAGAEDIFHLDALNEFARRAPRLADAATVSLLTGSRYAGYFDIVDAKQCGPARTYATPDLFADEADPARFVSGCCG